MRQRPDTALTYGPEVADLCARANFAPDPQQELGLDLIFAIRPDGSPASFSFCVICCRQNLKTGLFKQVVLGWLFVVEVPAIVWSAHEMSTTLESQQELATLMEEAPFLSRRMLPQRNRGVYNDNGSERIELASGQKVNFKARTKSGGRGLGKPKLILDEAFALQPAMMGALVPIMMAQPDAQMLYGSSAGKADSVVLRDVRDRGRDGISPRLSYLEWMSEPEDCADPECTHPKDASARGIDCALDREHLLRKANPTLTTGRITLERLADIRQELPPDEFMRECLGWWEDPAEDDDSDDELFPGWSACEDLSIPVPQPTAFAIAVSIDRAWTSIAEAGPADDDRLYVGPVARERGTHWVVEEAKRLQSEYGAPFVIDGRGPGRTLIEKLEEAGVYVQVAAMADAMDACADMHDDVETGVIAHHGDEALDEARLVAVKRDVVDRWLLGRKQSRDDVSLLEAAVLARWGVHHAQMPEVSLFTSDDLDLCDGCGKQPHDDPDGEHDFLCLDCREAD